MRQLGTRFGRGGLAPQLPQLQPKRRTKTFCLAVVQVQDFRVPNGHQTPPLIAQKTGPGTPPGPKLIIKVCQLSLVPRPQAL